MSKKNSGVKMQREIPPNQVKNILDIMAKYGVTQIKYDPAGGYEYLVEIRYRDIEDQHLLTREEKEYYAHEYDKCFGTAPRSDENEN